ncbi:MAG TPA: hypothetical protein VFB49_07725 [Patescibacteria group bacterium]|jgi:hypothetical protein|nr:hypothetical protein [Patescibacteria group bacterium]
MGKRPNSDREGPPVRSSGLSLNWTELATLVGLALVIVVGFTDYNATMKLQTTVNERLQQVENKINLMSAKVELAARPAAPRQTGPDPNKVYPVKIDGAPYEGPKEAPVTIAEFSDFQ